MQPTPRPSRLMPHPPPISAPQMPRPHVSREVLQAGAAYLLERPEALTDWERGFVAGMNALLNEGRILTPRQQDRLVHLRSRQLLIDFGGRQANAISRLMSGPAVLPVMR